MVSREHFGRHGGSVAEGFSGYQEVVAAFGDGDTDSTACPRGDVCTGGFGIPTQIAAFGPDHDFTPRRQQTVVERKTATDPGGGGGGVRRPDQK